MLHLSLMCGIFATTADQNSAQTILEGLKRLEYRGYDSWGIAVKDKEKLIVDKHTGKISLSQTRLPKSQMGIGHTRWATHGGVTVPNSHPHLDCHQKIAIVHNGIIDNWQKLKASLKGHGFRSQTDSEIVAHLLEEQLNHTPDLFKASLQVFYRLQGLNALLILHQDYPYLVAVKTGSPLIIGYNPGNHLVSSDIASLLPLTKQVVFLADNQIAKISPNEIYIQDLLTNKQINPKITTINWRISSASKGSYEHFMLKEIYEQPGILMNLAKTKTLDAHKLAQHIKDAKGTFTVACGSAAYAALAGQYFFSRIAKTHINPAIGSEFYYHAGFLNKDSLCIALSQSGETIDTIQSVQHAQKNHSHTISLVNIKGSTLDRLTDDGFYLDVGPEKAVASTKAFMAKVAILHLTAHSLAGSKKGASELRKAATVVKTVLHENMQMKIKQFASTLKDSSSIFILGKGQSYPAALEIALKIKEISYIHAEGFPSGELKHGVIALIQKNTPIIVLAPKDETYHDVISAAFEVKARGGTIIGFSSEENPVFDHYFHIPECGHATIIPHIILGQTLSYYLATAKGLDPDMPRNLAKSVTVK